MFESGRTILFLLYCWFLQCIMHKASQWKIWTFFLLCSTFQVQLKPLSPFAKVATHARRSQHLSLKMQYVTKTTYSTRLNTLKYKPISFLFFTVKTELDKSQSIPLAAILGLSATLPLDFWIVWLRSLYSHTATQHCGSVPQAAIIVCSKEQPDEYRKLLLAISFTFA